MDIITINFNTLWPYHLYDRFQNQQLHTLGDPPASVLNRGSLWYLLPAPASVPGFHKSLTLFHGFPTGDLKDVSMIPEKMVWPVADGYE